MNYNFFEIVQNPPLLKKLLQTKDFQDAVIKWTEDTLRPYENDLLYEGLCKGEPFFPTTQTWVEMHRRISIYKGGGAGHEVGGGHSFRDTLHVWALISNLGDESRFYQNEIAAIPIGGIGHDISTEVQPRYADTTWQLGHAEISGFILYHLLYGLFPTNVLIIGCYGTDGHTHQIDLEKTCDDGSTRKTWNDRMFLSLGKYVRIATWMIRFADRNDQGITQFGRHLMAGIEGSDIKNQTGKAGRDLTGTDFFELDEDFLKIIFVPDMVKTAKNQTSALAHIFSFAQSALKFSVYSQYDKLIPSMDFLISLKSNDAVAFVEFTVRQKENQKPVPEEGYVDTVFPIVWDFLDLISASDRLEPNRELIKHAWDYLTPTQKEIWRPVFPFIMKQYEHWMDTLFAAIQSSDHPLVLSYLPLIPKLKENLRYSK